MSNIKDGGPAFPVMDEAPEHGQHYGISARDYFAAKAMQGFLSGHISHYGHENHWEYKALASEAYDMADAMLAARDK